MPTIEQRQAYEEEGFFVVDDLVDADFLVQLREAAWRVKEKVRIGQVDLFTHWADKDAREPWAIRGLLAPEFDEPSFARHLLSQNIMEYVNYFIGYELTLGAILLFTNPKHSDWGFGWHRDLGSQERDGTEAQELKILNKSQTGLRWHLALVDDACLQIVPGSHKRYRTEHERSCLLETRNEDIPEQYTIQLSAGEAVFWNGNSIHRGIYKRDHERLTISASWSKFIQGLSPSKVDSRLEWRLNSDVRANLPLELHQYYDRWYELQLPNS